MKLNEKSQSSVANPSVTAIKLLVNEMLQHFFMEKINDRYIGADHTLLVDIHALQQENRSKISTESWSY
jgi:hypothetical protein